jgi:trehalose-6-phosphatase
VMFGDDITDVSGFAALQRLRENEGLATLSVAVASTEADPAVAAAADEVVDGVGAVAELLSELSGQTA